MNLHRQAIALLLLFAAACTVTADSIESLSGSVIEGKVISRDEKFVVMEVQIGGKPVQRKYGLSLIRAITIDGQREVLKEGGKPLTPGPSTGTNPSTGVANRTRSEIEAIINSTGKQSPDWLADIALNLPKSLDLSWPEKPEGAWNNQKNVGQFVWDVINPNDKRWREGIKLMEYLMEMHKNDPETRQRAIGSMAGMYHHFFQDYARAAYWWRQAPERQDLVGLAECYFKLGNKAMAVDILDRMRQVPISAIKLWSDMGEPDKALKLVELFSAGKGADDAFIQGGDACRAAGRYKQAIQYYEKVTAMKDDNNVKRNKDRAKASLEGIKYFDTFDLKKVADGTYKASSLGYEGPVEITAIVAAGKIESLKVTSHREKQYYASISDTPAQIIAKQSVKGIDATSRATITSDAIINATAKALGGGQ